MKLKYIFSTFAAVFVLIAACCPSRSDVTVVQKVSMDYSKMTINGKPIPKEQLGMVKSMTAAMGGMDSTLYYSGQKSKVVNSLLTVVTDLSAKKIFLLMPSKKQYTTMPLDDSMISQMTGGLQSSVKDLGKTTVILGHTAHLYKYYAKNQMMTMTGYVWTAADITDADAFQQLPTGQTSLKGVKGLPLKVNMTIDSPMFGSLNTIMKSVSISTDPIPSSAFDIPADYTESNSPAGLGGAH